MSKIEFRVAGANQDATSTRCDLSQDLSTYIYIYPHITYDYMYVNTTNNNNNNKNQSQ